MRSQTLLFLILPLMAFGCKREALEKSSGGAAGQPVSAGTFGIGSGAVEFGEATGGEVAGGAIPPAPNTNQGSPEEPEPPEEDSIGRFMTLALMQAACLKAELSETAIYYVGDQQSVFECIGQKVRPLALSAQTKLPPALIGSWSSAAVSSGGGTLRNCTEDTLAIGMKGTKGYAVTRHSVYQLQITDPREMSCTAILASLRKKLLEERQEEYLVDNAPGNGEGLVFTGLNIPSRLFTRYIVAGPLLTIGKVFSRESWKGTDAALPDLDSSLNEAVQLKRSN